MYRRIDRYVMTAVEYKLGTLNGNLELTLGKRGIALASFGFTDENFFVGFFGAVGNDLQGYVCGSLKEVLQVYSGFLASVLPAGTTIT